MRPFFHSFIWGITSDVIKAW